MAYGDNTLSANHQWTFNNTFNDNIGTMGLTNSGGTFETTPITRDSTHSFITTTREDRASILPTNDTGLIASQRYAFGGWFMTDKIQGPPTLIHKQGGATNGFAVFMWAGNNVMLQTLIDNGTTLLSQIFSDIALTSNRPYHIFCKFSGNSFDNEVSLFLDGVKQTKSKDGSSVDVSQMAAYNSELSWGENGVNSTDVTVGTTTIIVKAPIKGYWSQWWNWDEAVADITETQIRNDIFAPGAIPDIIITSDTEAAMQTQLDTHIGSTTNDSPLNFLIEAVTGDGDLSLISNNIIFNNRASIHVRYEGNGILNWINANGSNASKGSSINQDIVFGNFVVPRITTIDTITKLPIENVRVFLTDSSSNVIINDVTNVNGEVFAFYVHVTDEAVNGVARKGTSAPYYIESKINGTITQSGLDETVIMILDQ